MYAYIEFKKDHITLLAFLFLVSTLYSTYKWVDSYRTTEVKIEMIKERYITEFEPRIKTADSLITELKVALAKSDAQNEIYKKLIKK